MRSPLLTRPGAVEAEGVDDGVAAHYGDPVREQRALADGAAIVDLSHRPVVRVTGPDRLSWLHSLTTQHLTDLVAGTPTEALILSPHGHVEHQLLLVDDGESTWMHVEPGTAESLIAFLDSMRFLLRVDVTDVSDEWAVLVVPSSTDAKGLRRGDELFVQRQDIDDVVRSAALPLAGMWAYEALRVEARRPRLGFETDHRTIPHEVGWLESAVHLNKGCYRGQETVARVHNLGRPPRRLVFLHLDGSVETLPPHCAAVELDGRQVGFVTSSARHHELGPIALALIKRNIPADAALLAGGVAAAQEVVVPA
jgi:tRNA-modifying protein YgfZ